MARLKMKLLTSALLLAAANLLHAGTAPFMMVNGVTAPGIDVSLTIRESTQDGFAYDFVVHNNSAQGIVTGVYFEEDWTRKIKGVGTSFGPAVLPAASLIPEVPWKGPMGSHTIVKERVRTWVGRGYFDTWRDKLEDGLDPGQEQIFSFKTDTSLHSLRDLEDMLANPGYGVAIRMQDLVIDPYLEGWGLVQPIERKVLVSVASEDIPQGASAPTPTAALSGMAMLGIYALRRRRRA